MPENHVRRRILPTIFAAFLSPAAGAATMPEDRVCRFETIVECDVLGVADPYLCADDRLAFTVTAIPAGANQYLFEFTGVGETERFRSRKSDFGPSFGRGSANYVLGYAGEMPVLVVFRRGPDERLAAEHWVGTCDAQIDDVETVKPLPGG